MAWWLSSVVDSDGEGGHAPCVREGRRQRWKGISPKGYGPGKRRGGLGLLAEKKEGGGPPVRKKKG